MLMKYVKISAILEDHTFFMKISGFFLFSNNVVQLQSELLVCKKEFDTDWGMDNCTLI